MDLWTVKRRSSLSLSEPGQRHQLFLYLLGVSPTKAPGTLRCPAGLQCCPSLGSCGRQPAIVPFPFTRNLCFHLGLHLVNPILPFSSGWLPWPSGHLPRKTKSPPLWEKRFLIPHCNSLSR